MVYLMQSLKLQLKTSKLPKILSNLLYLYQNIAKINMPKQMKALIKMQIVILSMLVKEYNIMVENYTDALKLHSYLSENKQQLLNAVQIT